MRRGAAMKDDQVANMARISPTGDPKLWRSRKLIVDRPARVDHRSTPEVPAPSSIVSVRRHVYGHVVSEPAARSLARFINKRGDAPGRMSNVAPSSGINDVIRRTAAVQ